VASSLRTDPSPGIRLIRQLKEAMGTASLVVWVLGLGDLCPRD
jgi:hypothetical protein